MMPVSSRELSLLALYLVLQQEQIESMKPIFDI